MYNLIIRIAFVWLGNNHLEGCRKKNCIENPSQRGRQTHELENNRMTKETFGESDTI